MLIRVVALVVTLLLAAPSPSNARNLPPPGLLNMTVDGDRVVSHGIVYHYFDEVIGAYWVSACVPVRRPKNGNCLHELLLGAFPLAAGETGPVPCTSARYGALPPGQVEGVAQYWETYEGFGGGCSIEIRRNVTGQYGIEKLRGTFRLIVSPATNQGGPDRVIEGKFRSKLLLSNSD